MDGRRITLWTAPLVVAAMLGATPGVSWGIDPAGEPDRQLWKRALDNDYYKISLNVRPRIELADFEGFSQSEAYTMRTRAGIGSKPFWGVSAYAELENNFSFAPRQYFDVVETPTGQTPIADPPATELNQGWLRYQNEKLWNLNVVGGRQRIILDDQRFVGNVGWRQNEQTFDAAWASNSLGIENLELSYAYLWEIHRIFGDEGPPPTRDYDSHTHLVHLSYDRFPFAEGVLFAYLMDFDNSPVNSANSYGFRVTGDHSFSGNGPWSAGYALSYAYQTDAAENPVNYEAHYVAAEASGRHAKVGRLGVGYELLGSDDGRARFVTPLATAHKFNGFADVFLNNGGPNGLQDLYLYFAPVLPWKLSGRVIYHRFWSDEGGAHLGDEVDFVLSRPIRTWLTALAKGAWFDGTSAGPASGWRFTAEATFFY